MVIIAMYFINLEDMVLDMQKKILEVNDVKELSPDLEKTQVLSRETAEKIQVIVFGAEKKQLHILTTNNFPNQLKQVLDLLAKKWYTYELFYTDIDWFTYALTWYDIIEKKEKQYASQEKKKDRASGQSAIKMIKNLYEQRDSYEPGKFILEIVKLAYQTWASDLHFQSEEDGVIVKVRLDWVFYSIVTFSHADFLKYLQKLKYIAGTKMNIDYVPQDGRFTFEATIDGKHEDIDARCSFMPGIHLENAVIRFLNANTGLKTFEELGIEWNAFDLIQRNLDKTTWLIVVSGPTGSWKTTTLYSALHKINDWRRKIITLEDPIEYKISWIEQSQINYAKWYSFEIWLKAALRHDPDIILVGETRTLETADIAINASLTGHLVFTTLHTNSAIESISRLLSMGVKAYMLAPALNLVSAQRLVRRVDPDSMTRREATFAEAEEIKESLKKIKDVNPHTKIEFDGTVPQAIPTDNNNQTGYQWRLAITEVFEVTDDIKKMIIQWWSVMDIFAKARENGFLTMQEDGILKVLEWKTTLDELRRVL